MISLSRTLRLMAMALPVLGLGLTAQAEPKPYHSPPASGGISVTTRGAAVKTEIMSLPKGRSAIIDLPVEARDVFVSNPAVADAVLRTPKRIFVLGVSAGQSDAIFFDGMGRQIMNLSIRVDAPTDQLNDTISRLLPGSKVEAQSLNGKIIISGLVANAAEADQVVRLAGSYAEKPEDVINMLSIAGKDQVMLKVRVAEVQRSTIKQLGFNTQILGTDGSFITAMGYSVSGKLMGGVSGIASSGDFAAQIDAFERVGLIRTLAEPNLTAVSGESANFLAGGEYPVPTGQDTQGRVSIEFKPYGVGLGFTPVVMSGGRISLKLSTEVSELTSDGAFSLSGLSVPAVAVRRAETTVEMASGSSMMIAGLLKSDYKAATDALPGMATLPIIGSLFRSRDFLNKETELAIIITPYIVAPTRPDQLQTPADNLQLANDVSSAFMGNLNTVIRDRGGEAPVSSAAAPAYQAPIGYVIE